MGTLGNAFADTYFVDGVELKADLMGADARQAYVSNLRQSLRTLCADLDEATFNSKFKPKMYYMDRERYRCIVKVSLYGAVAEQAENLRAGYLAHVSSVHLKAHVFAMDDDWDQKLDEALYRNRDAGQQLALFGPKQQVHKEKGDGKGWRIGDRNSDYHFASYKRVGQRTGIEVRVQDRPIIRMRAESLDLAINHGLSDKSAWRVLLTKAAKMGADRFERDLELKSLSARLFFSGFTTERRLDQRFVTYVSIGDGQAYTIDFDTGEITEALPA